ncbi:MAG TPA: alpha/beta hydrolase fold domain-containing protein [Candidatus Binataceae bacterium]
MDKSTATLDEDGNICIGPRVIPPPKSISAQAQKFLATPSPLPISGDPQAHEKEAWRKRIARFNAMLEPMADQILKSAPATVETKTIAGVTVYAGTPHTMPERNRGRVRIDLHGGGMVLLAGKFAMAGAAMAAARTGCVVYSVDYRVPPDHPYPAALNDIVAVYQELLKTHRPGDLVISGSSGGGNLGAAAALKIRDLGIPLPAALVLLTPEVDLTESGDTFETNRHIDVVLKGGLPEMIKLYADGHDLNDPYLSPLFGDFTKGYPPTFIQTGTRDVFLSNSVRMHRALLRAGIEVELHVWEAMPHGGFGAVTPEDAEVQAEVKRFIEKHWGTA